MTGKATRKWTMHMSKGDVEPGGQGALCDGSIQVIYAAYRKDSTCEACKAAAQAAGKE